MKKLFLLILCFIFLTGLTKEDRARHKAWQKSYSEATKICKEYKKEMAKKLSTKKHTNVSLCMCRVTISLMNERIGEKYGYETRECDSNNADLLIKASRSKKLYEISLESESVKEMLEKRHGPKCEQVKSKKYCDNEMYARREAEREANRSNNNNQNVQQNNQQQNNSNANQGFPKSGYQKWVEKWGWTQN